MVRRQLTLEERKIAEKSLENLEKSKEKLKKQLEYYKDTHELNKINREHNKKWKDFLLKQADERTILEEQNIEKLEGDIKLNQSNVQELKNQLRNGVEIKTKKKEDNNDNNKKTDI